MPEVIDYIQTLRDRGLPVAYREIKSRLFREPPRRSIARFLEVLKRHNACFTFFVVGASAQRNQAGVRELLEAGHEVGSHGFQHDRFDRKGLSDVVRDLEACRRLFDEAFHYRLRGFRAPYLKTSETVARALRETGFEWSSSTESGAAAPAGLLPEFPVSVDDWSVLIKGKGDWRALLEKMRADARPGGVFLLHPWRVGQPAYIGALEAFLKEGPQTVTLSELAAGKPGVALTGDIGEFSSFELLARALRP